MEIFIERLDKKIKMQFTGKGKELLKKLSINPETIIIVKNSEVVSEDETLSDKDSIRLLSVISGG